MNVCVANALTMVQIPNPRDMVHVLKSIETHRITYYCGVPTMFIGFINFPDRDQYDLTSVRFAVSAAAPLPPEVQQQFQTITGGKMVEAYGLTETSPAATVDPIDSPRDHSLGVPVPDTDVKIVDTDTGMVEMPVGEIGEIIIKGPQVMKGYWNLPTETANALRTGPDGQPGWFYSGDIGYMDPDGYFHMADRKKDMIIAGGYNIYPADVEAVIFEHPKVKEAAVIGVAHPKWTERPLLVVVRSEGEDVSKEEMLAYFDGKVATWWVPSDVVFVDELPHTATGKVKKIELRKQFAEYRLPG